MKIFPAICVGVLLSACAMQAPFETAEYPGFDVRYSRGLQADQQLVSATILSLLARLGAVMASDPAEVLKRYDLQVFVYEKSTEFAAPGQVTLLTRLKDGRRTAELHLLGPSRHPAGLRTAIGEKFDASYFDKVLAHEIASLVLESESLDKLAGWTFYEAPSWFVQGYPEYLSLVVTELTSGVNIKQEYFNRVKQDPGRISVAINVADVYSDGSILVSFIIDQFGEQGMKALMNSQSENFWTAFEDELNITILEFHQLFDRWLKH